MARQLEKGEDAGFDSLPSPVCSYCGELETKHSEDELLACTIYESAMNLFDRDRVKKIRTQ